MIKTSWHKTSEGTAQGAQEAREAAQSGSDKPEACEAEQMMKCVQNLLCVIMVWPVLCTKGSGAPAK